MGIKNWSRAICTPYALVTGDEFALGRDLAGEVGLEAVNADTQVRLQIIQVAIRDDKLVSRIAENGPQAFPRNPAQCQQKCGSGILSTRHADDVLHRGRHAIPFRMAVIQSRYFIGTSNKET